MFQFCSWKRAGNIYLTPHAPKYSPDSAEGLAPEAGARDVEVTPAMIDAGLSKLYEFDFTQPDPDELREAVASVYRAAHEARHRSAS